MTKAELTQLAIAAMHRSFYYDALRETEVRRFFRRGLNHLADEAAMQAEDYFRKAAQSKE